jgi:hypothetical protein
VPRGYRIVLRDPARYMTGGLRLEIVRGNGRAGVLSIQPIGALPEYSRKDPSRPSVPQTAYAVARSFQPGGFGRARRVAVGRYLMMRGTHPVGFAVAMTGSMPAVVFGIGWGRALLNAVARTLVARWQGPDPREARSDPDALAQRDRANAAIAAQDSYTRSERSPSDDEVFDVIRSQRYQAVFVGTTRDALRYFTTGEVTYQRRSDPECWEHLHFVDHGEFLAPRLPVAAIGLAYAPPQQVGGLIRLSYDYWTSSAAPATVTVDLDPATMLPVTTTTDLYVSSWTWQPVSTLTAPTSSLC